MIFFDINEHNIHFYIKEHENIVSVLKIFSKNKKDFWNIMNKTFRNLENECKNLPKIIYATSMEIFEREKKDAEFLISYYFNVMLLKKIIKSYNYDLIKRLDN